MKRIAVWSILAGTVAGACDIGPGVEGSVEKVEDGVRVVDSFEPAWGERAEWRVASRPELVIPSWSAPVESDSFHLVDARKLTDGRLAIANGWADELRIYDADGALEMQLGGEGMAAGQFQSLAFVREMQGSIWAFDRMGRWNVYGLDGTLERSYYLEPHEGSWGFVAPFGTSSLAVVEGYGRIRPADGAARPTLAVLQYEVTGSAIGPVGTVPGLAHAAIPREDATSFVPIPFTGMPVLAGGERHLYLGTSDGMRIDVLAEDGSAERRIRIPNLDLSVSDEAWNAQLASFAADFDRGSSRQAGSAEFISALDAHRPATRPAYARMIEDALGNLWVAEWDERYQRRISAASTRWIVFDPDGRWLGRVATPEGLRLTQIGQDFLLGLARTGSGSEARLYALTR